MATEDFTDSIHPVVADYRKRLAERGLFDDKDDYQVARFLALKRPELLEQDPSFGELYGKIREANAPSLGAETGRAFKRAGIGLGSTAVGGAALITGSDYLKRKAAALSMQAASPDLAPTIPTLEDIRPGEDGVGQAFSRDAVRYGLSKVGEAVPSIGEGVALGLIGGAIGTAVEPGAGTAIGAGAGVVEGLIGRGIIRKAIQSLVAKGISEEAVIAGLRKGAPEVIEAVTKNAKAIAGARAGTVTAGLNSYLLNAGEVYGENDDRGTALALGLVSAIPDTVLPALVVRRMFPGVSLSAGREAAKELVGSNAVKVAKAAGVTTFEGATESFQEAVNIVARNLKDGADPFTVTDADKIRIREAGIAGAVGGALASPAIVLERTPEEIAAAAPSPETPLVPPAAPLAPPAVAPVTALPSQRVRAMTPEAQVARLAELQTRARVGDEEAELQILLQTVPREAVAPVTPAVVAAVAAGNLPLAPTATNTDAGIGETVLPEGQTPVDALLTQPPDQNALPHSIPPVADPVASVTPVVEAVAPVAPILSEAPAVTSPPPLPIASPPPSPVGEVVSPARTGTDRQQYDTIQAELRTLGPAKFGTPEYQALWAESEAIKNQNNGMPPGEVAPPVITFDAKNGLGSVPYNQEVAHRGFQKTMTPDEFIGLAKKKSGEETSRGIEKEIRGGKAVGPPFLNVEWLPEQGAWKVIGHEGRNRSEAIKRIAADTAMPVHLFPRGMRAKDITPEMAAAPIITEDTPAIPPRPSPEQRLNDAGIDLKPLSQLSRAEKRQELDQAGVTTYNGKKLDDINPAELSAALGKLRRGQLDVGQPPAMRTSQTETPEFRAWFGGSKVVDEGGKPLVVYHGTTRKNVKTISPAHGMEVRDTAWFSDSEDVASEYTLPREYGETVYEDSDGNEIEPGTTVEVFLSLKNPMVVDFNGNVGDATRLGKLVTQAKAAGHDGLIIKNVDDGIGDKGRNLATSYAIFSPTQVKSATANRGTFDPTNPDITARTASEPVKTSTEPTNPAVLAQRTQEFQAVLGRLVANGANVQVFSHELLAQQTGEVIQQQLQALQQRLAAATTAPQRNEIAKQIATREERAAEIAQMRGVTFSPYHIAVAMDDVANANLDNLVTLLHEAAESLTMRLSPAQQGAVFRAVEATTAQMNARMQAAAKNTGATVANVPVPSELLAETMAQALAAEGIPNAPSLAQAIARWIKEIYYRVAMAAQRAFGAEPSPEMTVGWYENQLRRELGGDYEYAFASLLDRFLPQPNSNFTAKFSGATGTPGGVPDFFDPTTQKTEQPWVEPLSDAALSWNMKFQTVGVNPGESEGIPAEEAVARQTAAAYNEQIKWLAKLHDDIAPTMDMQEFLGLVSRGEKTPHEMLDVLKTQSPGVETAVIGGERMTDPMNKWAAHQTLEFMKGVQGKHLTRIAQMQEAVKDADERFTEHASELNRLEPDVKNAELHEGELRVKVRGIIEGLLKSYKNGLRTSSTLGRMIEAEEDLSDRDPLPQFYAQAFANLLNADVPLFDYVEAIAMLDLPVLDMTPEQIWKKIRENADTSPMLRELSRNKPLVMTLSVLAKNSARQLDQIQLRRADAETFLNIRTELEGIRNATEAQLREMLKAIDEKNEAKGLRQRIKVAYLKERRALKRASDRIALVEERIDVLEKAKPAVAEKIGDMQQAIGGVFSEWTPGDGAELTVMRRRDDGSFQKATRTLEFNKDGSAVDSAGILNDLAQNQQWLKANVERAGQKEYETVKHQTRATQMMDVQRAYLSHNYGKVIGFIDAFVRPLQAIAKQAGHAVGNRIVQQFNKYEFINRSGAKALQNQSYEWGAAMNEAMKSLGITDVGLFRSQIYNPVKFWLGVNPGLDQAQAIRGAIALARKQSAKVPTANFNAKFEAFLLKDKEIEDELLRTAESNGVLVWDAKLGELRKAIARGWSTGMRMMNDGVVATLVHDMEKSGWKLEFDAVEAKKSKKVVTRSTTFDALNPANATSPEEREEYYAQLENTDALRAALKPYFTPGILQRWLLPFINKPGESVFNHAGRDISQLDLQNAWAKAQGDVLNWIDILGQSLDIETEEGVSEAATFRWDMLRQIEHLFKWEAGMAYEAEQTPDLFSNQGAKLHVMMDARVNDLLPAEHVNFAMHDPTSVRQMLGQIAFHGAFGRNGAALMTNLKELEAVSVAKKFAFDGLRSTTVEGRKREAKEKGYDYNDLKRAVDHYHDVLELKGEIESAMGVKNIYGPLYDARAGMELLGFMVGQVVDQPKTGALNFLSIGARPFAMHSFSPKVLKATALSYGDLAKNTFGNMLRDFGIDLIRMSDYAKETGEVEGKAFRRLPYGTVLSGDTGKDGSFQDSLSSRFMVQPLRIFRALQKKGVGPGIAAIPGLGTMQRFATEGAMANIRGQTYLLQDIINNGIRYFSAHPEDLANPAFRFDQNNLKLKADRGMYDWFRNKTVEYNMGTIEGIVREAMGRQAAGERTITTEMVEQLAQMNAQELDGASSINTAPAGLAQNQALRVALPLLRWPLWMMHAAHEGLADANGRLDFKSMMAGIGRLAAWNLPLGLAFTFMIDEYDEKILKKKNAMPEVSGLAALPVVGVPLALATSPRSVPQELLGIGQRMIRSGNIYGLGGDMVGALAAPFDPGSGQRAFSLDQRVLIMSQFLNMTQAISNMVNQGGTATWGSVYRPLVASIGGNGMLNSLDVVNNLLSLDNAESRLTQRINAARWVSTAAKELEIETKKASGFSNPTEMSVWTREMQLAAMANSRVDFMEAYRKALNAARERVGEDDRIKPQDREKESVARVLASWRARNPFSGLASTPTPAQIQAMLNAMNDQGRADVRDAMRYYDAYTQLIKPSETSQLMARRMQASDPARQMESMRRRAAAGMMVGP